jgi:hypothetical protein
MKTATCWFVEESTEVSVKLQEKTIGIQCLGLFDSNPIETNADSAKAIKALCVVNIC